MKGKEQRPFAGFRELHPAIQVLLILSALAVFILIYVNPPAAPGIVAFLLALKGLWSDGPKKDKV